jgi:hypothetical protein
MRLPGFNASSSLYRTSSHYRIAVGGDNDPGTIGIPPLPGPFSTLPPSGPFPHPPGKCKPCYWSNGVCLQDCQFCLPCPPGEQPNGCGGCTVITLHCRAETPKCPSGYVASCGKCCPSGQVNCSGTCVDLSIDPDNCGACGNSCAPQSCCAGVCCEGGTCCWNGVCVPQAPAPPAYGLSSNWPLYSDCQNIQGLTVQFVVNEPFVPTPASNGFSLQVNGYAPLGPGLPCNGIDWLQYILIVENGQARAQIQYWNNEICENLPGGGCCWTTLGLANQCGGSCQGCAGCNSPGNAPWLPLGDNLFYQQLLPNNVPSTDIIPKGSLLGVSLTTNTAGQVTEALFEIIIDGVSSSASYQFPPDQQYGFPAFVPVVVASQGSTVNLSGSGQLYSSVSSGELCVQTEGAPGSVCGVTYSTGWPFESTGETSNAVYGPIYPCCGSVLGQSVST